MHLSFSLIDLGFVELVGRENSRCSTVNFSVVLLCTRQVSVYWHKKDFTDRVGEKIQVNVRRVFFIIVFINVPITLFVIVELKEMLIS